MCRGASLWGPAHSPHTCDHHFRNHASKEQRGTPAHDMRTSLNTAKDTLGAYRAERNPTETTKNMGKTGQTRPDSCGGHFHRHATSTRVTTAYIHAIGRWAVRISLAEGAGVHQRREKDQNSNQGAHLYGQRQLGTMTQPSPLMDFCDFGAPVLSALLLPRSKKGVTTDTILLAGGGGPHSGVPNGIVRAGKVGTLLIQTNLLMFTGFLRAFHA